MREQNSNHDGDPSRELRELVTSIARSVQANSEAIAELREGQRMMAQIFQERDARLEEALQVFGQRTEAFERRTEAFERRTEAFERRTEAFEQEMQAMRQEIADLRRDFLEFLTKDNDPES